jgi:hypothetical protein
MREVFFWTLVCTERAGLSLQPNALLAALRVVWGRVEGTIMMNPQARIVETVETRVY